MEDCTLRHRSSLELHHDPVLPVEPLDHVRWRARAARRKGGHIRWGDQGVVHIRERALWKEGMCQLVSSYQIKYHVARDDLNSASLFKGAHPHIIVSSPILGDYEQL
jgi:hypothetical protein